MIVVHPTDPSTRCLSPIYEGLPNVRFFDSLKQREEILQAIRNAPLDEPVFLLGHGTPAGLLDMRGWGLVVTPADAALLSGRPNLCGIWCYASTYAARHSLKGFFSGMFVSEYGEALSKGVDATPEEIEDRNWDFSGRFGDLLREGKTLEAAAKEMMDARHIVSDLTRFNYSRLTWRPKGNEPLPVDEGLIYW